MCVSIETEAAAKRYIAEMHRVGYSKSTIRNYIRSWQRSRRWLLDYSLITCVLKKKRVRKPPVPQRSGMKVLREAVREVERTAQPVKEREKSRLANV